MVFTDEHWSKVEKAIGFKVAEAGPGFFADGFHSFDSMLSLFRENWDLFADEKELDKYIKDRELAEKKEQRSAQAKTLAELDSEIKKLEK